MSVFLLSESAEFGHLLANIIADTEFALIRNNFIVLLVFKFLFAHWIVANHLPTSLLMALNLNQRNYFWTKDAFDVEGVDHFFDDT